MANGKAKEIMEKLENGIKEAMDSEKYKNFLRVQSQFHSYSFNNAMLIYLQRPDATRVAGFQTWKKMGRFVKKGEKGIGILAPSPYKTSKFVDKLDPKTKQPIRDSKTGEILKEKKTIESIYFRKVNVFDIKQTGGKELPTICNELQGNSVNAEKIIDAIKKTSETPVIFKNIESRAKGYYSRLEDIIVIQEGMSLDQTAKTLIHENAHSRLHNIEASALLDRATKEVQAESVAFIVSDHFGVDTSQYSFEYLASWSSGKELQELKQSFNLIQKTANDIINKIENVLEKELQLQNSPAKIEILWSESEHFKDGQILDFDEANKIFEKLELEQSELRKANDAIDYTKVTAGDNVPYVPYLKTKFKLHLSDGRSSEARFDIGDSDYKNLYECVQKECYINMKQYIKDHEIKQQDLVKPAEVKQESISIKDKIINQYKQEFPSIKHISEKTAQIIDNLNQDKGTILSIKDIKEFYKEAGKKLEISNSKDDMEDFKVFRDVIEDLKQSQLTEKQLQAQERATVKQLIQEETIEMIQ